MTAVDPGSNPRAEWRELVAWVLVGIVALTVYGMTAPTRVHLVQLPMTGQHPDQFGLEDWVLLLAAFIAGGVGAYIVTLFFERRIPRFRWQRAPHRPADRTLVVGTLLGTIGFVFYNGPTHGLVVFSEHSGAYIWAPPDLATKGILLLAGAGIGVSIARIAQILVRVRRGSDDRFGMVEPGDRV